MALCHTVIMAFMTFSGIVEVHNMKQKNSINRVNGSIKYSDLEFTPRPADAYNLKPYEVAVVLYPHNLRGLYILRGTDPEGDTNLLEIHPLEGSSAHFDYDKSSEVLELAEGTTVFVPISAIDELLDHLANAPRITRSIPYHRHWYDLAGFITDIYYNILDTVLDVLDYIRGVR